MKKYKWLIAGIAALILATAIVVFSVSAKPTGMTSVDCVEDGSCCEDEEVCTCGSK
jgi:hypothetical protein